MRPMDRETESIERLLRSLDHAVPAISAESIAAKARARSRGRTRWLGAILTVAVAGAVYAAPGSPLRAWMGAIVERRSATPERGARAAAPPAAPALSGIAIDPGTGLVIVFESPRVGGAGGLAIVSLEDGAEAVVRAPRGAATFTTGAERLAIGEWDASARFEIVVPRSAPRVEIRVGARTVFVKSRGGVSTTGIEMGPGRYTIPLELPIRPASRPR